MLALDGTLERKTVIVKNSISIILVLATIHISFAQKFNSFYGIPIMSSYDNVKNILADRGYQIPALNEIDSPIITLKFKGDINGLVPQYIQFTFNLNRELAGGTFTWFYPNTDLSERARTMIQTLDSIENLLSKKYGVNYSKYYDPYVKKNLVISNLFTEESTTWCSWDLYAKMEDGSRINKVQDGGDIYI